MAGAHIRGEYIMPSLVGTSVAANYLKAAPSTRFSTRELSIVKIVITDVDLTPTASNSNFSKAVRALQQTAEVYAIGKPVADGANDYFQAIIATDTQWDGVAGAQQGGAAGNGSFDKLEAAFTAAGLTATVTIVAL